MLNIWTNDIAILYPSTRSSIESGFSVSSLSPKTEIEHPNSYLSVRWKDELFVRSISVYSLEEANDSDYFHKSLPNGKNSTLIVQLDL